ncbi:MAG: PilW family protein [Desulfuromonadales bacterium]|nr:PilW family protein [Desulfuromonadales bacterium]
MTRHPRRGHSLVELLVAMGLAALVGTIVLPAVFSLQSRSLAEVSRTDLQGRAGRLLRFFGDDLRTVAFQVGATPRRAAGAPPVVVHDSAPGSPAETLAQSLLPEDGGTTDDDALTLVKAESFFPSLHLSQPSGAGAVTLLLDRHPNQPPGSSREIRPAPEAISHVVLANHRSCYPVGTAGQTLQLLDGLAVPIPRGTELLGLRAHRYHLSRSGGFSRLRCDDFTSDEILDDAVDGLQFEYLLADGRIVDVPDDPQATRGVRVSLLVRDLRPDRDYRDRETYRLGNRSYGPYNDAFRRIVVSEMVEVKNHALP